jgi:hypothetical protein
MQDGFVTALRFEYFLDPIEKKSTDPPSQLDPDHCALQREVEKPQLF